jgi:DNA topoisomerase VI subunit B
MSAPVLDRLTFKTSRLAEFCSEKELINQTGHDSDDWPLVVLKELVDNALDACEEGGVAPDIHIAVSDDGIAVTDNGPGIAPDTVADILDYTQPRLVPRSLCEPYQRRAGQCLEDHSRHGIRSRR